MQIYPNDIAKRRLERAAEATGRTVEDLATSAAEEAALAWARDNGHPGESQPADGEHVMKAGITQDEPDLHRPHPLHDAIETAPDGEK